MRDAPLQSVHGSAKRTHGPPRRAPVRDTIVRSPTAGSPDRLARSSTDVCGKRTVLPPAGPEAGGVQLFPKDGEAPRPTPTPVAVAWSLSREARETAIEIAAILLRAATERARGRTPKPPAMLRPAIDLPESHTQPSDSGDERQARRNGCEVGSSAGGSQLSPQEQSSRSCSIAKPRVDDRPERTPAHGEY